MGAKASSDDLSKFSSADIEGWGTTKLIVFLDCFLDTKEGAESRLSSAACEKMANLYNFLNSNCEIRVRFLRACLCAGWSGAQEAAVMLATSQGRMKFTRPIYRALKGYDAKLAKDTFAKHRNRYHPVCAKMVAQDLEM